MATTIIYNQIFRIIKLAWQKELNLRTSHKQSRQLTPPKKVKTQVNIFSFLGYMGKQPLTMHKWLGEHLGGACGTQAGDPWYTTIGHCIFFSQSSKRCTLYSGLTFTCMRACVWYRVSLGACHSTWCGGQGTSKNQFVLHLPSRHRSAGIRCTPPIQPDMGAEDPTLLHVYITYASALPTDLHPQALLCS